MKSFISILFILSLLTACNRKNNNDNNAIGASSWDLNDVSILYPITAETYPHLIGMVNNAIGGGRITLMSRELFNFLGTKTISLTENTNFNLYESLRITAVRIDPCNDGLVDKSKACVPVLRVVAQPITVTNNNTLRVHDASIHLFYELTQSEFSSFVSRYNAIRGQSTGGALYVHPILAQERLQGRFSDGLKELFLTHLQSNKIVKFTFMATGRNGTVWTWGGFFKNELGQPFRDIQIPLLGSTTDSFTFQTREVLPPGVGRDTERFPESLLWNPSIQNVSNSAIIEKIRRVQLIENPVQRNAGNVNCSSCHQANSGKQYSLSYKGLQEPLDTAWQPRGGYNTHLVYKPTKSEDGKNFHAFSYFGATPTVSQRVINESALVADFLNGLRN